MAKGAEPGIKQQRNRAKEQARKVARRRRQLRRWALPILLVMASLGGITYAVIAHKSTPPARPEAAPVLGSSAAKVVLAEYGDFQCHACGAFARLYEPKIRKAYIDSGKVRLEWHDYAWYGPESNDAANAARCAGDQGKFWEYHDVLYHNQGGENSGTFSQDHLKEFARTIGLGNSAFDTCVNKGTHLGAVQADMLVVNSLGLTGTPSFFVNGQAVPGSPQEIKAAIDAALT